MIKKIISISILLLGLLLFASLYGETPAKHYRSFTGADQLRAYMKWSPGKKPLISAHRGGPMDRFPENAVETFENTLRYAPCLIECDVRTTKDNQLVMMHDDTLDRTTTGSGKVSGHTLPELKKLFLEDNQNNITPYRIPTFGETLRWAVGRAVLTVDVKRDTAFARVISEIRENKAEGHVVIIVYSIEDLKTVHQLAPDLVVSAPAMGIDGMRELLAAGVPFSNICAFVGVYEPPAEVYHQLHQRGISTILGTMHNLDRKAETRGIHVYRELYRGGADILSTDNIPLLSKALAEWNDFN